MYNQENAHTGNFARRSEKLVGETPDGCRTGTIAEISRRAAAWLAWREGLAPKPKFLFYNPRDRRTWYRG